MYAYSNYYLENARAHLGEMFDCAINVHNMNADIFWDLFAFSKLSECLSCGDPKYIAGMSGQELFAELIFESYQKRIDVNGLSDMSRSREYWAGWALAKYQWYSGRTYRSINRGGIRLTDILDMYILHEAPDEKFITIMSERLNGDHGRNLLKRLRAYAGLTQKELAQASGVSFRMIQLYEQGQNDLARAQAGVVVSLANTLGCDASELVM